MIVCIAESRQGYESPLQILLSGLNRYEPDLEIYLFLADPTPHFLSWIAKNDRVQVRQFEDSFGIGWSAKPHILRSLLREGHDSVLWLDSDIVINGPFWQKLRAFSDDALVVAEEALAGRARRDLNGLRARRWGFPVGRTLPFVANTCVLRVGAQHDALLSAWADCMTRSQYLQAQSLPFAQRPPELGGDQDALTALLCADRFKHIEVGYLFKGRQILQYYGPYGFTFFERIMSMILGTPPIIHSQAAKPWISKQFKPGLKEYLLAVLSDVSPYIVVAKKLGVAQVSSLQWTKPKTRLGSIMILAGAGSASLTGMPIALAVDAVRLVKFITGGALRPLKTVQHLRSGGSL